MRETASLETVFSVCVFPFTCLDISSPLHVQTTPQRFAGAPSLHPGLIFTQDDCDWFDGMQTSQSFFLFFFPLNQNENLQPVLSPALTRWCELRSGFARTRGGAATVPHLHLQRICSGTSVCFGDQRFASGKSSTHNPCNYLHADAPDVPTERELICLYRQLDWFKRSISVLSANREIQRKHHNCLLTNCFYWLNKTVCGPMYWSTSIFIVPNEERASAAACGRQEKRRRAKSAVWPLQAFQVENHAGHHRTFSWKRWRYSQNFCVLQIMSCNYILFGPEAVTAGTSPSSSPSTQGVRASILSLVLLMKKRKQSKNYVKHIDKTHVKHFFLSVSEHFIPVLTSMQPALFSAKIKCNFDTALCSTESLT